MTARLPVPVKFLVLALLLALVALLQVEYDRVPIPPAAGAAGTHNLSPEMVRMVDLGFHSAVASFLWAPTMPEILDLFAKKTEYFPDLAFVTGIDPKLSYPYAFSVLTLPVVPTAAYPQALEKADEIGIQGLRSADPDWRIPYYLATNEFLYAKDSAAALKYYDVAARTPGIPQYAARFSLNFGIETNQRKKTEELWATIRDSTNDKDEKARAQAYIDHLMVFDYLDAASAVYKKEFGAYPKTPDDLVAKGIIPSVPADPFGFLFVIEPDGTTGIDLTKIPPGLLSAPVE